MDALGSVSGSKYSYFCTAGSHGNSFKHLSSISHLTDCLSVCPPDLSSCIPAFSPPGAISQSRQQLFAYPRNLSARKEIVCKSGAFLYLQTDTIETSINLTSNSPNRIRIIMFIQKYLEIFIEACFLKVPKRSLWFLNYIQRSLKVCNNI